MNMGERVTTRESIITMARATVVKISVNGNTVVLPEDDSSAVTGTTSYATAKSQILATLQANVPAAPTATLEPVIIILD